MKYDVMGVKVDKVSMDETVAKVEEWIENGGKHYIVTPNIEFLMLARQDPDFKKILNRADLAVPDSARLSWAYYQLNCANPIFKVITWPFFLMPNLLPVRQFDVVTGTDLMDRLIRVSSEKGYTVSFLGGDKKVAERLRECLQKLYPKLKISYASSDIRVDRQGIAVTKVKIPDSDILFVAFGQGKQEKWIMRNLEEQKVKVMIGVGGAFDYLAGDVPRAPEMMRKLGFEWLFRVVVQPWRIARFLNLLKFIVVVLNPRVD